jgi:FAD/FMN-containing dehydrogenase
MLGGGHGLLQGRYGLLADNLVEARLVLANSTAVTVSSDSHPDLYWALKGAGHNFGIVTELKYKIYDIPKDDTWVFASFFFPRDKIEEIYAALNDIRSGEDGLTPVELVEFSIYLRVPDMDPNNVSLDYQ